MSDTTTASTVEEQVIDSAAVEEQGEKPLGDEGLKALKAEREARKSLERQLRELRTQVSPEAARAAEERARAAEEARLRAMEEADQKVKRQQSKFEQQLEQSKAELEAERQQFRQFRLRMDGRNVFSAAEGLEGASVDGQTFFDYFWATHGKSFAYDDAGTLMVVDAQGDPVLDEETGKRIAPTEWVKRLHNDPVHGHLFKPAFGSGSGGRSAREGRPMPGKALSINTPKSELFKAAFGQR